jgi:hypothetical protein
MLKGEGQFMTEIFGLDKWEKAYCPDKNKYALFQCQHEMVGKFFCTDEFIRDRTAKSDTNYKVLSLLWEHNLKKEIVVLFDHDDTARAYRHSSPEIAVYSLNEFLQEFPKNIVEKQYRILMNLYHQYSTPGDVIAFDDKHPWHFYALKQEEMAFLFEGMREKGWLDIEIQYTGVGYSGYKRKSTQPRIAEGGWTMIEKTLEPLNSIQAFIAMSFASDMKLAGNAIQQAITDMKFKPMLMSCKEHNEEISGEMLYEISKSRFVVADVTGQRRGVYFEAGFAIGRGIPVIWSCREDEIGKVHPDTRQYNHVTWNDEKELTERLTSRIKGTILLEPKS